MKCVVFMLLVLLQVDASYQQNILPEHKRRHCNALQTADIMEHALPEIRRILQAEAEKNRHLLQAEAENIRRLHAEHVSALRGVILLRCEPGWVYHNDNCYMFSQTLTTWQGAIGICQNMNAYLAEIQSYEENQFVKMELSRFHAGKPKDHDYFLGGRLNNTESKWTWIRTGEQIRYTDWGPNEPNDVDGDEGCLTLFGKTTFQWNDDKCSTPSFLICKKRVELQVFP